MLLKMMEEKPVGIVIRKSNREIIKANRMAAEQYGLSGRRRNDRTDTSRNVPSPARTTIFQNTLEAHSAPISL